MNPEPSPEEMLARRQELLRQSREQHPESMTPPPASEDDSHWKMDLDLEATRQEARQHEAAQPIRALGIDGEDSGWRPGNEPLLPLDAHGHVPAPANRAVDLHMSTEYGLESREAIAVINRFFLSLECSELHFNQPDQLFAKVHGERVRLSFASESQWAGQPLSFSSEEDYNHFIEQLIERADTVKTLNDIRRRCRDVVRMAGGDRMTLILPPFTETMQVSIHKVVARNWRIQDLISKGTMTPDMARFLQAAVHAKCNILVIGEMGAGKSTTLSLLAQEIGDNERVALIEEVPEIFVDLPDVTRITYYPTSVTDEPMGLAQVLDTVLYMRMDRVMVGEIHEFGMYHMLRVMSNGGDGSMSTFHADNTQQALIQVQNNVQREEGIPPHVAAHFIRRAIDLVVAVERIGPQHRIKEIVEVIPHSLTDESQAFPLNPLFEFDRKIGEFRKVGRLDEFGKIQHKASKHNVHFPAEWFALEDYGVR